MAVVEALLAYGIFPCHCRNKLGSIGKQAQMIEVFISAIVQIPGMAIVSAKVIVLVYFNSMCDTVTH